MAETETSARYVGPVMKTGEMGSAVAEAVRDDNPGREILIEEHASYLRIKVAGACLLTFASVADLLGRDVQASDIEAEMPAFEGFIRVDSEKMRFLAE